METIEARFKHMMGSNWRFKITSELHTISDYRNGLMNIFVIRWMC